MPLLKIHQTKKYQYDGHPNIKEKSQRFCTKNPILGAHCAKTPQRIAQSLSGYQTAHTHAHYIVTSVTGIWHSGRCRWRFRALLFDVSFDVDFDAIVDFIVFGLAAGLPVYQPIRSCPVLGVYLTGSGRARISKGAHIKAVFVVGGRHVAKSDSTELAYTLNTWR